MNGTQYFSNLQELLPHYILLAGVVFAALWNLFRPNAKALTPVASILALAAAMGVLSSQFAAGRTYELMNGIYTADRLASCFGILACLVGIVTVLMTMGFHRKFAPHKGEFYAVLLTAILATMFLAGTTDLIMLFVSMETLTLCCVILAGFLKRDYKTNEAALKYLLSTAATTATFMYGISFLYGLCASTNFYEIHAKLYTIGQFPSLLSILIVILMVSVIGFKLSLVPFHLWTPDVYEGAPTPVTAFLSVGSKLGGLVVAIRLLCVVMSEGQSGPMHTGLFEWTTVAGLLALASMIFGNLIALAQRSVKRMLAYSSIAHVGYLLIGLCSNTPEGLASMMFYVIVYGFMNLGAFAAAIMIENELGTDKMDDWCGLIRKRPWVVLVLTVCLLNLAGLPVPPAGFFAKFFVFWSGFQMAVLFNSTLAYCLVGAGLITSIPAVFYYSRVAINMIVKDPSPKVEALPERRIALADSQLGPVLAIIVCLCGILAGSFTIDPLMGFSRLAIESLRRPDVVGALPPSL